VACRQLPHHFILGQMPSRHNAPVNSNVRPIEHAPLQPVSDSVLAYCGFAQGARGEERSLYSPRHNCIMYRLLYGEGLDLLTLARNARTSTEMIERFYASHLEGEMNIEMLQSRRGEK
jgi:hypothetical protein